MARELGAGLAGRERAFLLEGEACPQRGTRTGAWGSWRGRHPAGPAPRRALGRLEEPVMEQICGASKKQEARAGTLLRGWVLGLEARKIVQTG